MKGVKAVKKWFLGVLTILLLSFLCSSILAGQKLFLQKSEKISRFSLGKLVQTCKGLKIASTRPTNPIRLNTVPGAEKCHWFDADGPFGPIPPKCMPEDGPVLCDCADVGLPEPPNPN